MNKLDAFKSKSWAITSNKTIFGEDAIYCFKKEYICVKPQEGSINITADARYKLSINGKVVSFGPNKGSGKCHFYETVDISEYLIDGVNTIEVNVLQLKTGTQITDHRYYASVPRTGNMLLMIWGYITDNNGTFGIFTDSSWICSKNENYEFFVPQYAWYGGMCEKCGNSKKMVWDNAKELFKTEKTIVNGEVLLWEMFPSNMPKQRYEINSINTKDIAGNYDYGKVVTGFVRIKTKGKGSVKLTYSECYSFDAANGLIKRDRTDTKGKLVGDYDIVESVGEEFSYETFWFRTFRFIRAEISGDIEITELEVAETGYPIITDDCYDFGNEKDNKLWDISLNTLKCCMHETFEDCPYYEQFQYAMDTYMQMQYLMKISEDISLVKRGISDFASSILPGSFSQSKYPSIIAQYIPGFSLYLIYMLDALEKNRNEKEFIRNYLGTVDNIVMAFEKMKRQDGLIAKNDYWCFVDWVEEWNNGVPPSENGDALTVYNLMYAVALIKAARIFRLYNWASVADEYEKKAEYIKKTVNEKCFCKEQQLYADTDKKQSFSQHSQVWAVLSGLVTGEKAKDMLKKSMQLKVKGGFAYAYHIFRAFETADCYELSKELLSKYYNLIDLHCTSIPEIPNNPRSECHGWGAVMLYEFTTIVLGVLENEEGIVVKPYMKGRKSAKGCVVTKFGKIYVEWTSCENRVYIKAESEHNTSINVIAPNGKNILGKRVCVYNEKIKNDT